METDKSNEDFYSYKARKESFVSNLKGTTRLEIVIVGSLFPAVFCLYRTLVRCGYFPRSNLYHTFLKEFILLIFVPLLCTTVLIDYTVYIIAACILCSSAVNSYSKTTATTKVALYEKDRTASFENSRLPFISVFRCGIMLYTCIAILAVDFHAFPRRLAKTETFGTSLMDLGVGMFIFSGGLVSRVARDSSKVGTSFNIKLNIANEAASTIKSVMPMLLLGVARFATTKGVEYQEHTSEYGVHWNFFFTLAVLSLFTGILRPILIWFSQTFKKQPKITSLILFFIGIFVTLLHQYYLSFHRYQEIVLGTDRSNILLQNKEGICSLIGFFSIYLIASSIGSMFMRYMKNQTTADEKQYILNVWKSRAFIISILCFSFWFLSYLGYNGFWPIGLKNAMPSRRMANTGYVVWITAHATGMLIGLLFIDLVQPPVCYRIDSLIVNAVNKYQLQVFLLANICTGVVNVSMKTLDVQNLIAVVILTGYMITVTFLVYVYTLKTEKNSRFVGENRIE
eukprot:g9368.t1